MQMESGSVEKGRTMMSESSRIFPGMSQLNQQILELETQSRKFQFDLRMEEIRFLQNVQACLTSVGSEISAMLDRQAGFDERLKDVESEVKKIAVNVAGLSPSVVAIDKNLREIRNLVERVADKTESLSEEFVEHYVKDPLIENVAGLYNIVRQMSREKDSEEHSSLLEQVRQLLDAQDARIIEPETGSNFDPREHRPVKRITTPCKDMENKISRVLRSGLGRNGRVVQHAVVELFVWEETTENKNTKKEAG